jgi:amino acid permease
MIIDADTKAGGLKGFKGFCKAIGGKKLVLFYTIILCFTIYGTLIGYQVIIASMIQRILLNAGVSNPEKCRTWHIALLSVFIIFPLSLLKGVTKLRYATILSITSIAYTTLITIIELPFFWINSKTSIDKLVVFRVDWSFFSAFGITFFAFMSQTGFYTAIEQLTKRDDAHLRTVI